MELADAIRKRRAVRKYTDTPVDDETLDRMLRLGVIVRPIASYGMPDFLRVSIGLPEENARFLAALRQALPR